LLNQELRTMGKSGRHARKNRQGKAKKQMNATNTDKAEWSTAASDQNAQSASEVEEAGEECLATEKKAEKETLAAKASDKAEWQHIAEHYHIGTVSVVEHTRICVACLEPSQHRDVYADSGVAAGLVKGDIVSFRIHLNAHGHPAASAPMWKLVGQSPGLKPVPFGQHMGRITRIASDGRAILDCPDLVTDVYAQKSVVEQCGLQQGDTIAFSMFDFPQVAAPCWKCCSLFWLLERAIVNPWTASAEERGVPSDSMTRSDLETVKKATVAEAKVHEIIEHANKKFSELQGQLSQIKGESKDHVEKTISELNGQASSGAASSGQTEKQISGIQVQQLAHITGELVNVQLSEIRGQLKELTTQLSESKGPSESVTRTELEAKVAATRGHVDKKIADLNESLSKIKSEQDAEFDAHLSQMKSEHKATLTATLAEAKDHVDKKMSEEHAHLSEIQGKHEAALSELGRHMNAAKEDVEKKVVQLGAHVSRMKGEHEATLSELRGQGAATVAEMQAQGAASKEHVDERIPEVRSLEDEVKELKQENQVLQVENNLLKSLVLDKLGSSCMLGSKC